MCLVQIYATRGRPVGSFYSFKILFFFLFQVRTKIILLLYPMVLPRTGQKLSKGYKTLVFWSVFKRNPLTWGQNLRTTWKITIPSMVKLESWPMLNSMSWKLPCISKANWNICPDLGKPLPNTFLLQAQNVLWQVLRKCLKRVINSKASDWITLLAQTNVT